MAFSSKPKSERAAEQAELTRKKRIESMQTLIAPKTGLATEFQRAAKGLIEAVRLCMHNPYKLYLYIHHICYINDPILSMLSRAKLERRITLRSL